MQGTWNLPVFREQRLPRFACVTAVCHRGRAWQRACKSDARCAKPAATATRTATTTRSWPHLGRCRATCRCSVRSQGARPAHTTPVHVAGARAGAQQPPPLVLPFPRLPSLLLSLSSRPHLPLATAARHSEVDLIHRISEACHSRVHISVAHPRAVVAWEICIARHHAVTQSCPARRAATAQGGGEAQGWLGRRTGMPIKHISPPGRTCRSKLEMCPTTSRWHSLGARCGGR